MSSLGWLKVWARQKSCEIKKKSVKSQDGRFDKIKGTWPSNFVSSRTQFCSLEIGRFEHRISEERNKISYRLVIFRNSLFVQLFIEKTVKDLTDYSTCKDDVCNLRRYFTFGPILNKNIHTVHQYFTLCLKVEGQ